MSGNDNAAAVSDLTSSRVTLGAAAGRWTIVQVSWPSVLVDISAYVVARSPESFCFRLTLDNYPHTPPAGVLWDRASCCVLPPKQWPMGGRASLVFNPGWNAAAIYHPLDRVAQHGHDVWRTQSPQHWWSPESHIADYLNAMWSVLNSSDYQGIACAA